MKLRWTHLSLFYLVGYLLPAGLMLLFVPNVALTLLLSNASYDAEALRLAGIALTALGVLIAQMLRLQLEALYPTTLAIRVFIIAALAWLYVTSGNPFFLVLVGIVGLGFVLTLIGYLVDRRAWGELAR